MYGDNTLLYTAIFLGAKKVQRGTQGGERWLQEWEDFNKDSGQHQVVCGDC